MRKILCEKILACLVVLIAVVSGCAYQAPEGAASPSAQTPSASLPPQEQESPPSQEPESPPTPTASPPSQEPEQASAPAVIQLSVAIKNFAFNPSTMDLAKGTIVTWTNEDSAPHTVTGTFDSGTLRKGQSFSYTFDTPGTFEYACSFHPSMKGRVTVK